MLQAFSMSENKVHFVGHSTVWVTIDGLHFIIDTNFSNRVWLLKRKAPLGIDVEKLPNVSALLVTHAHYDHLDLFSYKYFDQKKEVLCPPTLGSLISRFINNPVTELAPWETKNYGSVTVTAVPTRHYGFRLSGLRYTQCTGYIIQGKNLTVYHPGDTAYGPHFKEIGEKFKIDVACLPIGAFRPRWFMQSRHMSPIDALQAFDDLKAKTLVPIHWGSFRLAQDSLSEAIEILQTELQSRSNTAFLKILQPGENIHWPAEIGSTSSLVSTTQLP